MIRILPSCILQTSQLYTYWLELHNLKIIMVDFSEMVHIKILLRWLNALLIFSSVIHKYIFINSCLLCMLNTTSFSTNKKWSKSMAHHLVINSFILHQHCDYMWDIQSVHHVCINFAFSFDKHPKERVSWRWRCLVQTSV